jgi:hypothetical protein
MKREKIAEKSYRYTNNDNYVCVYETGKNLWQASNDDGILVDLKTSQIEYSYIRAIELAKKLLEMKQWNA